MPEYRNLFFPFFTLTPPYHSLTIIRFEAKPLHWTTVRNGSVGLMLDRRSGVLLGRLMLAVHWRMTLTNELTHGCLHRAIPRRPLMNLQTTDRDSQTCFASYKRKSMDSQLKDMGFKRRRECTRVPCRARNMPPDHDEETAYLEIPTNAPHGMLLGCSHPACGGYGRKRFRYCAVCNIPVSKRNFVKRHSHHNVVTSDCSDSSCISSASTYSSSCPSSPPLLPSTSPLLTLINVPVCVSDEDVSSGKKKQVSVKSLDQSERNWLNLLHQCPDLDDGNARQRWMQALVATAAQCDTGSSIRPSWQTMTKQKATEATMTKANDLDLSLLLDH